LKIVSQGRCCSPLSPFKNRKSTSFSPVKNRMARNSGKRNLDILHTPCLKLPLVVMAGHKVYDVSLTIYPGMPVWLGNPPLIGGGHSQVSGLGGSSNVSLLYTGAYTATHIDAPCHFIPGASARVFLQEI